MRGNDRPLSYFVDHWNYFNERAARTCFSIANYQVLRIKKDLSLQGFLVRKVFPRQQCAVERVNGGVTAELSKALSKAWLPRQSLL
jgi:hypothetical protein